MQPVRTRIETLNDLLADAIAEGGLHRIAAKAQIRPYTLLRLRKGIGGRTHAGTVAMLARALRLPVARVGAAIRASRAAAKPD